MIGILEMGRSPVPVALHEVVEATEGRAFKSRRTDHEDVPVWKRRSQNIGDDVVEAPLDVAVVIAVSEHQLRKILN